MDRLTNSNNNCSFLKKTDLKDILKSNLFNGKDLSVIKLNNERFLVALKNLNSQFKLITINDQNDILSSISSFSKQPFVSFWRMSQILHDSIDDFKITASKDKIFVYIQNSIGNQYLTALDYNCTVITKLAIKEPVTCLTSDSKNLYSVTTSNMINKYDHTLNCIDTIQLTNILPSRSFSQIKTCQNQIYVFDNLKLYLIDYSLCLLKKSYRIKNDSFVFNKNKIFSIDQILNALLVFDLETNASVIENLQNFNQQNLKLVESCDQDDETIAYFDAKNLIIYF